MKMLIGTVLALGIMFVGCSGEKKEQAQKVVEPVKKETPAPVAEKKPEPAPVPVTKEVEKVAETAVAAVKDDGATLFKICATCHGDQGEKKALNQSQIIQGWSEAKVYVALKGYKDGTYGGMMKMTMIPQVQKLSDAQMKALAAYISKL